MLSQSCQYKVKARITFRTRLLEHILHKPSLFLGKRRFFCIFKTSLPKLEVGLRPIVKIRFVFKKCFFKAQILLKKLQKCLLDTLASQTNRIRFQSHFWLVYKASKMRETPNEKALQLERGQLALIPMIVHFLKIVHQKHMFWFLWEASPARL